MLLGSNEKSQDSEGWHVVKQTDKINCSHCKKTFKQEKRYLEHHDKEHKMKAYICYICDVQIRGKKKFLDHRQKSQCHLFVCNSCDFKTNKFLLISNHVKRTIHLVRNQHKNDQELNTSNQSHEKDTSLEPNDSTIHLVPNQHKDVQESSTSNQGHEKDTSVEPNDSTVKDLPESVASDINAVETSDKNQVNIEKEDPKNLGRSSNEDNENPPNTPSPEEPENLPHKNQECDTTETKTSTKPSKKSSKNSQKNLQSKNPNDVSDNECANDKSDIIDNNKKLISDKDIPTGEYQGKSYSIHDFCVNIEKVNIKSLSSSKLLENNTTSTPIKSKRSTTKNKVHIEDISYIHERAEDETVNSESVEAKDPSVQEANLKDGFLNKFTDFIKNINNDRNMEDENCDDNSLVSDNCESTLNKLTENPGKKRKRRKSLEMLQVSATNILYNKRFRIERKSMESKSSHEDKGFDDSASIDNGGDLNQSDISGQIKIDIFVIGVTL